MLCTYCGGNRSKVIDSRDSGDGIRRRRECLICERRYTTMERVQTRSLMVVKQDERREDFSRDKLLASLNKACAKRPLPIGTVAKVAEEIESALVESGRARFPPRLSANWSWSDSKGSTGSPTSDTPAYTGTLRIWRTSSLRWTRCSNLRPTSPSRVLSSRSWRTSPPSYRSAGDEVALVAGHSRLAEPTWACLRSTN